MTDLQELDPVFPGQVNPALQIVEAEGILAVGAGDLYQLGSGTLFANIGVQRGRKYRCQDQIKTKLGIDSHISIYQIKPCIAENLYAMVRADAVAMKPVGIVNRQLGKLSIDDLQIIPNLTYLILLIIKNADLNGVSTCNLSLRLYADPVTAISAIGNDKFALCISVQRVRCYTRLLEQKIIVVRSLVNRHINGHIAHLINFNVGRKLGNKFHGVFAGIQILFLQRHYQLEGMDLILQHGAGGDLGHGPQRAGEYLFQTADGFKCILHNSFFLSELNCICRYCHAPIIMADGTCVCHFIPAKGVLYRLFQLLDPICFSLNIRIQVSQCLDTRDDLRAFGSAIANLPFLLIRLFRICTAYPRGIQV